MSKHNLLIKKIKNQVLSINDLIESYFNKFKYFKSNYKKILLSKDNRVFLVSTTVIFLSLFYFLIPTFYNKDKIQIEIENQILKKYNIDIKFDQKIRYGLLPKPHFSAKDTKIFREKKEIANIKNFKIFMSINQLLKFNTINVKDLIFKKANFNINNDDLGFFKNLLKTEPNENKIIFKNSRIFFKNINDEILFINKIDNIKYYYDSKNLENILSSKSEIFNVPFKFTIKNDRFNKKVTSNFNSKKIRLTISNDLSYDTALKKGLLEILFINKNTSLNYKLNKDNLSFKSTNSRNSYDGIVYYKPFYLLANFNYEGVSSKNILDEDSILIDLLKSDIFNNPNLNVDLNFNVKDIININELNNLSLKIGIEAGKVTLTNSRIMWKDDLEILFKETLLNFDKNQINFNGKIIINIKDKDDFYSSYQIKKLNRKDIDKIEFDFFYNLEKNEISFDNVKIDNSSVPSLNEFINTFNSGKNKSFNKITLKNFVSSFFSVYAG